MPKITTLMQKSGRGIDRILSLNELALHNRCGETLRQSINVGLNFPFSSSNSLCVAFNVAVPCVPQAAATPLLTRGGSLGQGLQRLGNAGHRHVERNTKRVGGGEREI